MLQVTNNSAMTANTQQHHDEKLAALVAKHSIASIHNSPPVDFTTSSNFTEKIAVWYVVTSFF